MSEMLFSKQLVNQHQLMGIDRGLIKSEMENLWYLFSLIEKAWSFDPVVENFRSRWEEMILARCRSIETIENNSKAPKLPSYVAEYVNASLVVAELREEMDEQSIIDAVFFTKSERVLSRLEHMKFFVVQDFIKLFIFLGGFKQFGGGNLKDANYRAYMNGSRFSEFPPVRTNKGGN